MRILNYKIGIKLRCQNKKLEKNRANTSTENSELEPKILVMKQVVECEGYATESC